MILFEDGQKIGEISEWKLTERFPEKKTVLGKEIITAKPKDQCEFISPKPVNRKKRLWLIAKDGTRWNLSEVKVKGVTSVVATVDSREKA